MCRLFYSYTSFDSNSNTRFWGDSHQSELELFTRFSTTNADTDFWYELEVLYHSLVLRQENGSYNQRIGLESALENRVNNPSSKENGVSEQEIEIDVRTNNIYTSYDLYKLIKYCDCCFDYVLIELYNFSSH